MTDDERAAILERVAADPVVMAREALRQAMARFVRWPWSRRREADLLAAMDAMHDAVINRIVGATAASLVRVMDRLEDVRAHQGRHEVRIAAIERERARAVGDAE